MQLARVIGSVTATQKDFRLNGRKLLMLAPLDPAGKPVKAGPVVAVDIVGSGREEVVLFVTGSAARRAAGGDELPVDAAVVGIVDQWEQGDTVHRGG